VQSGLDEAQLLPLTETPVTERLLAAVHARLSRQRTEGEDEATAAEMAAAGGVSVQSRAGGGCLRWLTLIVGRQLPATNSVY